MEDPERSAVLIDFDGTLAPIVERPEDARPLPGTVDLLGRLAGRLGRVAVVSGRPLSYLITHLSAARGVELAGLYGMERTVAGTGEVTTDPAATEWMPVLDEAASAAERDAPAGVTVEHKGLAVTIHFRRSPASEPWAAAFAHQQKTLRGLAVHPGKMSFELRPPVETDKGTVVAELAVGMKAVCFIGDDVGDLPAFAALRQLAEGGVTTFAIAVSGAEMPPGLAEASDLVVEGPEGVVAVLAEMEG